MSYVSGAFCSDSFTLTLNVIDTPKIGILNLKGRDKVCFDFEDVGLELISEDSRLSYLWSSGETEKNITVTEEGTSSVVVSNEFCESVTSYVLEEYCPGKLFVPNAFTPQDDGMNERFQTKGYNLEEFEIWIYNRWGQLLFNTTDVNNWWDGTYLGSPCQMDVYVWKAKYTIVDENGNLENFNKVGRVSLIR